MKNRIGKAIVVIGLVSCLSACWTIADGKKTGIIVKLAKEGAFHGTYEAELIRGGFSNGSGANGQSFHFTIENDRLVKKLKKAFENQDEVIIKYHTEAFRGCMRGQTDTFLDDVQIKRNSK